MDKVDSNRVGRPDISIDWKLVCEELEAGSSGPQIADKLGIHSHTLYRRVEEKYEMNFTDFRAIKLSAGDDLLRKAQFDKAIGRSKKGDTVLLTFLGKVRLKQRENPEITSSPNDQNLDFADAYMKSESRNKALEIQISELEERLSAFKPQADSIIQRSDETVQHLGRGSSIGQNLFEHS